MDFIIKNFEIITIISLVILLVLVIFVLSLNKYFAMYFSNKKFHIRSSFEIDAKDESKMFTLKVFNRNINDVRLSGFGFLYKGRNIDFYKSYLEDNQLPANHKIVISSRDFLETKIDTEVLKNVVSDINHGSLKMLKLQGYVTDSLGLTSRTGAKEIKNHVKEILIIEKKAKNAEVKAQKMKLQAEEKMFKQNNKVSKKSKRKERLAKISLRFKKIIAKLKGNKKSA